MAGEDEPDNITNNPIETLNDIHKDCLLNGPVQISTPISIEPINSVCTQYEKNLLHFYGVLLQEISARMKQRFSFILHYCVIKPQKNGKMIQFIC